MWHSFIEKRNTFGYLFKGVWCSKYGDSLFENQRYSLKAQQTFKTIDNLHASVTNEEAKELLAHCRELVSEALMLEGRPW